MANPIQARENPKLVYTQHLASEKLINVFQQIFLGKILHFPYLNISVLNNMFLKMILYTILELQRTYFLHLSRLVRNAICTSKQAKTPLLSITLVTCSKNLQKWTKRLPNSQKSPTLHLVMWFVSWNKFWNVSSPVCFAFPLMVINILKLNGLRKSKPNVKQSKAW